MATINEPFLVLCNHAHTLDPFFVSALSPVHIRWVAGAYLFKLPFLSMLLHHLVGAISKQQGRSDMHTLRQISAAFKKGDVVGIFPEGTRTWDGEPMGFDQGLAKLIKLLKVPVVLLNFEGLYAIKPRWSRFRRKGAVSLTFKSLLSVEEAQKLSVNDLYNHLNTELGFSFRTWQHHAKVRFSGKRGAEGVEKTLYLCPSCTKGSTITSKGRTISCTNCSLSYTLNEYELIKANNKDTPALEDIAAWRAWQNSRLIAHPPAFPDDRGVLFQQGSETQLTTMSRKFTLRLERMQMILSTPRQTYHFAYSDITSMIINAKNTLELYCSGVLYRIRIAPNLSILKYLEYYQSYNPEEATS